MAAMAEPPLPPEPPADPKPDTLAGKVFAALYALPPQFESDLVISGVRATDLHTFNASLGATIEEQVVDALNALRSATWDQDEKYAQYRFVRQPQTFPDVVLKAAAPGVAPEILLGIELKGWYVLAKEREPSFRYRVTPAVCAHEDLLVVFPWALSRVISGSPQLFIPYVASARYAAEYRNWHWKYQVRSGSAEGDITVSSVTQNYPSKAQEISDVPVSDRGGNFGRFARTDLMNDFMDELFGEDLMGIPLDSWQKFLRLFGEQTPMERINRELDRMAVQVTGRQKAAVRENVEGLRERLREVVELLDQL
jgi:hypothetical protein